MSDALGMIETKGFVAAAADAVIMAIVDIIEIDGKEQLLFNQG